MSDTIQDAAGRDVHVGDTVGGTTSGRYQATIIGPIVRIGKGQVKVQVTGPAGDGAYRPKTGDEKWISSDRVFLVDRKPTPTAPAEPTGEDGEPKPLDGYPVTCPWCEAEQSHCNLCGVDMY